MVTYTCIKRLKGKKGKIVAYRLKDELGCVTEVDKDLLKLRILTKFVKVTNLKLTSDNRLVEKKNKKISTEKCNNIPFTRLSVR